MNTQPAALLEAARELAKSAETWADLSNALFDPDEGIVAKAFTNREARQQFMQTKEYKAIQELISDAQERTGLVAGATPKQHGRYIVMLPQSVHDLLVREATTQGISMNHLMLTKLAVKWSDLLTLPAPVIIQPTPLTPPQNSGGVTSPPTPAAIAGS